MNKVTFGSLINLHTFYLPNGKKTQRCLKTGDTTAIVLRTRKLVYLDESAVVLITPLRKLQKI